MFAVQWLALQFFALYLIYVQLFDRWLFALQLYTFRLCNVWLVDIKGNVSQDYKYLEVILIKSPLLGHVTPDI